MERKVTDKNVRLLQELKRKKKKLCFQQKRNWAMLKLLNSILKGVEGKSVLGINTATGVSIA